MIKQGIVDDGILEKKFKILRTSIMLGNSKNREETIANYEETAKEIDRIRRDVYEELLASKMYHTSSMEEERNRLVDLIDFTSNRIKERNDFIDDYIKITSNFLDDLPAVSNEDELEYYQYRLNNIEEYLKNCEEIKRLNIKLKEKRNELEEKYEHKANSELINSKLEDELVDEFNRMTLKNDYYSSLNYMDIDNEISKIEANLEDKKEVMDTFISSYDALKSAGISGTERDEYLSYVADAKKDYYDELEKKYILNIYKLVLDKENDYDMLYQKRLHLDNILKERAQSRKKLEINSKDELEYFTSVCDEQFSVIKSQKLNIEDINKLIIEISDCENKLDSLDNANSRSEIVELLEEFSESSPEIEKIDMPQPKETNVSLEVVSDTGEHASNMVVKVRDPIKINVKNASDTVKLVMKKVVIVLEPKKFNGKRDKLKEAEQEILKEKLIEKEKENSAEIFQDDSVDKPNDDTFVTLDTSNNTEDSSDDVFVDNNVNILLDTQEVKKGVKNTLELDSLKVNESADGNLFVPTEIFIDETKEKQPDLFSQTDPFLDDNQYEKDDASNKEDVVSKMPQITNIGTVRPTSMLSKVEKAAEENDDIILPTMGLVSNEKTDVPIVSENYIN